VKVILAVQGIGTQGLSSVETREHFENHLMDREDNFPGRNSLQINSGHRGSRFPTAEEIGQICGFNRIDTARCRRRRGRQLSGDS